MSSDESMDVKTPTSDGDVELILEDEIEEGLLDSTIDTTMDTISNETMDETLNDALNGTMDETLNGTMDETLNETMDETLNGTMDETLNGTMDGETDTNGTKDDEEKDDDIVIYEPEERTKLITDEMYLLEEKLRKEAEKFFDPTSPTNVINLSQEARKDIARYAAAIFEWICCLPTPELLTDLYMGDINLPFPITPNCKRVLVRRDYGARLTDVWRQTKSTAKLANHFKLKEQVALLSLLDYGFNNPTHDLDVFPLLKAHEISRDDYYTVAHFIVTHRDPRLWKAPEILLCEAMIPPLTASITLYLMNTECSRGTQVAVPWEELDVDLHALSASLDHDQEQALLEAMMQLAEECPVRKRRDETQATLRQAMKVVQDMEREVVGLQNQIVIKKSEHVQMQAKAAEVLGERQGRIHRLVPKNFEAHGAKLAKADSEITWLQVRDPQRFTNMYLTPQDVMDPAELDDMLIVLARRKECASEKFVDVELIKWEDASHSSALVRFAQGEEVVSVAVTSLALTKQKTEASMPSFSEGVRVVALVVHPCHQKERPAYYSGTIISKYDVATEEYAIAFDDFFEDYASIHGMRLLMKQPFDEHGEFDKATVYKLMTPTLSAPIASIEERTVFLLLFFSSYPEWGVVKMNEKVGRNVSTVHRNGEPWVAQALKVDRLMVWLRFNPKNVSFFAEQDCLDMPCKAHVHYDEKMYRGNPRLKQLSVQCHYDAALKMYRAASEQQRNSPIFHLPFMKEFKEKNNADANSKQVLRHNRRQQVNSAAFENTIQMEPKSRRQLAVGPISTGGPFSQTARKQGVALQIEAAVPNENGRRARKREEPQVEIAYHDVEQRHFSLVDEGTEGVTYQPDFYHEKCTSDCLKGNDADPTDPKFTKLNISPYFIPIMCGWRRIKQDYSFMSRDKRGGVVYYRTPCNRPLHMMSDVLIYLDETRSDLTVDVFSFTFEVDETAYVQINEERLSTSDLSFGAEGRPISVLNEVDDEPVPSFIYRARRYPQSERINMITTNKEFCSGCECTDDCRDWTKCACQRLTHRESVRAMQSFKNPTKGYTNRLLNARVSTGIYECNENCGCSRKRCINRVVQNEIKVPMQMMKTRGMGWGVRALVDIPHGTFISCYHGAVVSDTIAEQNKDGDEYYADLDFYNIVETEKVNSGIDMLADQGVFFEDVGARDLTDAEVEAAAKEDELGKLRREVEEQKKAKRKEEKEERRRLEQQREQEEEEEEIEENGENGENGGIEDEDEEEEEGDENGDGEDADETIDEGVDEGVEEGDSADSMDEEEEEEGSQASSSPDEERRKIEEEEKKRKAEEGKKTEERKKEEAIRQKQMKEDSKMRWTIPIKDENDRAQYDAYFEDSCCDHLYLIDAKAGGNIGRQFNHSCEPNMFTQHIFVDTHDIRLPWVAFFAKKDIKAGEELCWDYGWNVDENHPRGVKCLCGAETCRVDLL